MVSSEPPESFRFLGFTLDVAGYQLRRADRPVRLERQPMDLLILLVERRGQLVSRDEIIERLWGKSVFVDVETGVHTAVRKIRSALGDSSDRPKFVETVSGKGYRFIAPVEVASKSPESVNAPPEPTSLPDSQAKAPRQVRIVGPVVVAALLGAIGWYWLASTSQQSSVRIAVLPFENLTGSPDRDYLGHGLAEEMVVALDKIDPARVSVVGRSSMRGYQRTTKLPAEIGRELGADYLLDSSIRADGNRLRITAKLIRVSDQLQVWSQSFDRDETSMLGLQEELSAAIAGQIHLRLSPARLDDLTQRQTRDPDAYDLYLRGRNFARQRTPPTTARAIEYFRRATEVDPDYALAWSGMSHAYAASPINGDAVPLEVWPLAREAADHAVRANPNLAEAVLSRGYVRWMFEWDWPAAESAFRRALSLDPHVADAPLFLAHVLSQMGRHDEAKSLATRARELDPLYSMTFALSAQISFQASDYTAAEEFARQTIALDPEFWIAYMQRGQALERLGQTDLALEALNAAARFSGYNTKPVSVRGYVLARMKRDEEAREVLNVLETTSRQRYVPPYAFALIHAGLGDRDAAFASLERAYDARDVHLIFLPVDAKWDPFRTDPRFQALIKRCFGPASNPATASRPPGQLGRAAAR